MVPAIHFARLGLSQAMRMYARWQSTGTHFGRKGSALSLSLSYTQVPYSTSIPNILTEFGVRLREMRCDRKLSEVDLAWRMGITRAHLQDIEEGAETIDLDMLSLISGALGITLSTALEGL